MKPFYVRHKTRDEAIEVIDRAVAHGATLFDGVEGVHVNAKESILNIDVYEFIGVNEENDTYFHSSALTYGENTQELTMERIRKSYPLPIEAPTPMTVRNHIPSAQPKVWTPPKFRHEDDNGNWKSPFPKQPDPGQHYRFTYKGIKLDPFRIAQVYGITDFGQQTMLKKVLRMGTAHKDKQQDLKDIICAAERMLEMMEEDSHE